MTIQNINHILRFICVVGILMFSSSSYAQPEINNADTAILYSETEQTIDAKVEYLIHYANSFMENEQYADVKKIAEYILVKLNDHSEEAKQLLDRAKVKIQEKTIAEVNPVEIKF